MVHGEVLDFACVVGAGGAGRPADVIAGNGAGSPSAVRRGRLGTNVRFCLLPAFFQVGRCTTSRPRPQAGVELYWFACGLPSI